VIAKGQLVVLESTTFPGTTRDHLVPLLEESGLVAGEDFALAFSPERVDPGRTDFTLRNTPKIVGGLTLGCTERALGIDIWEVVDAAASKPFGFMRFEPGPGMGGHCLPVDPFYLTWKAREYDMVTEFIELAGKVNNEMPYFCLEKIERALNDAGKPVKGSCVLIVGVAYKGGVGDLRESPALKIIELLQQLDRDVSYHDPHVPELPPYGLANSELERPAGAAAPRGASPRSRTRSCPPSGEGRTRTRISGHAVGAGFSASRAALPRASRGLCAEGPATPQLDTRRPPPREPASSRVAARRAAAQATTLSSSVGPPEPRSAGPTYVSANAAGPGSATAKPWSRWPVAAITAPPATVIAEATMSRSRPRR